MLEAGRTAEAARAWTEASDALERAAALAATGAGSLAPIEIGELLMRAAILADFAGDLRRGLDLGRAAVDADDGADPRRSGVLLNTLGTVANDAGDFDLSVSANEQAILLIPAEPPSVERADAVATLGARRMILNRNRDAIELVDDAIAFFRTVDQPGLLGAAMAVRGLASASLGRADEARVAVDESLRIYGGLGDDAAYEALEIITNSAFALHVLGDFDRVPQLVDGAMAYAAEIGDERGWGIWLEGTAALTAFVTGDWAVAAERSRRFTADSDAGFPLLDTVMMEAELAAGRGDRRRVEALLTGTPDTPTHQWFTGQFARINAVAALWDGDAGAAATSIEAALATMATQDEVPSLTEILKVAVRSYTDIAERRRATRIGDIAAAMSRATELAADVASLVDGTYLEGARSTPWMQAIGAPVAAETGRAEGRSDPQAWASAAAAHAAVGTMPEVAYCRYRQAEALLTAEDRSGATAALVEAVELARRIGMVPLVGWIETIARRSRLSIEASVHVTVNLADEPHDPWGLSPREREVLDLLGEGRTNRQIGETLFISEKTASVHVTHILGKLGVSSRTEAALLAGRSRARP
jgi:DNA-binding CsgD family transcriptional regulator/tetratricopeptide (TPR) repeat protein